MEIGKGRILCLAQIHLSYNGTSWRCNNCREVLVTKSLRTNLRIKEYTLLQAHFQDINDGDYLPVVMLMTMLTRTSPTQ